MADGEDLGLIDGSGTGEEEVGGGNEESFILEEGADEGADKGGDAAGGADDQAGADGGSRAIVKVEPLEVRKALREISTANPEFAKKFPTLEKSVTRALFQSGQVEKFGGLQKVAEAFEALEVHGGVEGLQEMADEVAAGRELEIGFKRGDPKIVDGWAKDYPDGFAKLVPVAFDKLESLNKDRYEAVASYVIRKVFESYGVYNTVAALGEALGTLEAGKDAGAIKLFNQIAKFLTDSKALADKTRDFARSSRDDENDERETELEEEKKKIFYGSVRADVNTQVISAMNRLIRTELNGSKIKVTTANRLRKEINAELSRVVNSQSGYADRYVAVMDARNRDRAVNFILSNARKYLPRVVKQLIAEFNLRRGSGSGGGNGTRREAANRGGGDGATFIGRPKTADVDFSRTDKAIWLSSINAGKATGPIYLKNGKAAKW